jgi:hypothetical protein
MINKNNKKLDKPIRRVYDQKIVTYDKNGKIVEYLGTISDEDNKK